MLSMEIANNHTSHNASRGALAIFIALLVLLIITSSAVVVSRILSRQIRLGQNVIASERAFYAADAGLEQALYELIKNNNPTQASPITGTVDYHGQTVTYQSQAFLMGGSQICALSEADAVDAVRRVTRAAVGCVFP
jgi:Tfp pilus assembly protein PilX